MSSSTPQNLPPIEPRTVYRRYKVPPSDADEVVYNPRTKTFQTASKSCLSCCFRGIKSYQRHGTWHELRAKSNVIFGKQIGELAFSKTGLDKLAKGNSHLTRKAYNNLNAEAFRLRSQAPLCYEVWKTGLFYKTFLNTSYSGRGLPQSPLMRVSRQVDVSTTAQKNITIIGLQRPGTQQIYNIKAVAKFIMNLPCEVPVSKGDAKAMATSIYNRLSRSNVTMVNVDEMSRQMIRCIRQKEYTMSEPAQWKELEPLVNEPFGLLEPSQFAQLVRIASLRVDPPETKERKNSPSVSYAEPESSKTSSKSTDSLDGQGEGNVFIHNTPTSSSKLSKIESTLGIVVDVALDNLTSDKV